MADTGGTPVDTDTIIRDWLWADPWCLRVLETVARLALPDAWVGAGFVRARVWDRRHGYRTSTPLADLDVIYFDAGDSDPTRDRAFERQLAAAWSAPVWSVKNQARMHRRNGDRAYRDSADAMAHWLEAPTCVGARLERDDTIALLAPHGLDDLWRLRVRPTPAGRRRPAAYRRRVLHKAWGLTWPGLTVEWI